MYFQKTTERIVGSSGGTTQVYSSFYLNGYLLELGLAEATTLPITTGAPIQLYRETTVLRNRLLETVCPTSETTWRPTFGITSTSTIGGAVVMTSNLTLRQPMLFADERILCVIAKTSKGTNKTFNLITRTNSRAIS